MKRLSFYMNVLMSVTLSVFLSLLGLGTSGHFTVTAWLASFSIGAAISFVICYIIPMGSIKGALMEKFDLKDGSKGEKVVSAIVSDVIFTPLICLIMVSLSYNSAIKNIENAKSNLQHEYHSLSAQLIETQDEHDQLQRSYDSKLRDLRDLQAQYDEKGTELDELQATYDAKGAELDELTAQIDELNKKLEGEDDPKKAGELKGQIAGMTEGKEALEGARSEMEGGLNALKEARSGMEGGIASMTSATEEMKSGLESLEKGISSMQEGIEGQQKGLENIGKDGPKFIGMYLKSMLLSLPVAFVIIYIIQPLYIKILSKRVSDDD